ncbi:putative tricarboxylic transport membrane protein [Haloechinothrix alba]|uniref:Putative tricarboxylic transport membrane protein n=1 Tax=Haloechinothrix alba TaxID=664784 RepID=A0A238VUJ9_9PSEU|nr:tripartite tricarboxylate transporter TctB family protein [Haloechinothrix alba]SNR37918.1 putative tricarboxylic transport membrane protein [Haloechinothrix alba]
MTEFRFSHRTIAVAIAGFALVYLLGAYHLPGFVAVDVPVQPATLPRGLGYLLLGLAAMLFFQRAEQAEDETATDATATEQPAEPDEVGLGRLRDTRLELAVFLVAACLYVALFAVAGFVLATAAYIASTAWYLGYPRHLVTVLTSVTIPLAAYIGMSEGLGVALPNGPLPF